MKYILRRDIILLTIGFVVGNALIGLFTKNYVDAFEKIFSEVFLIGATILFIPTTEIKEHTKQMDQEMAKI